MFCFGCDLPVRREEDLPANYTLHKPTQEPTKSQEDHAHATTDDQLDATPVNDSASSGKPSGGKRSNDLEAQPPVSNDNGASGGKRSNEQSSSFEASKPEELSDLEDLPPLAERELVIDDEDEDFEFDAEAFARARKKSDEVSKKIGKHMLMGWTLMDIHCSTDFCPLMRSVDHKSMMCLSCGTEYEDEATEADDIVKITSTAKASSKELPLNPPSASSSKSAPRSSASSSTTSSSASSSATRTPLASSSSLSSRISPPFQEDALRGEMSLGEVLTEKLAWARRLLHETQSITECQQLADAIRSLLLAIAALK